MPSRLVHKNACALNAPPSPAETLENPTTSPHSLMAIGVFQATPPSGRSSLRVACWVMCPARLEEPHAQPRSFRLFLEPTATPSDRRFMTTYPCRPSSSHA